MQRIGVSVAHYGLARTSDRTLEQNKKGRATRSHNALALVRETHLFMLCKGVKWFFRGAPKGYIDSFYLF